MVPLAALWLPILLSAVIVFVVSSLIHMVLPWHENDYVRVPTRRPSAPPSVRSRCRRGTTWYRARAAERRCDRPSSWRA